MRGYCVLLSYRVLSVSEIDCFSVAILRRNVGMMGETGVKCHQYSVATVITVKSPNEKNSYNYRLLVNKL